MQVEINKIINAYLEEKDTGVTSYLYQAPTKEETYIVLTDISDRPTLSKDQNNELQSTSRMQLSIFTSNHQKLNQLKTHLQKCLRTTKNEVQDLVTWVWSRDNFSENIFNKETRRYQCVIDFFVIYIDQTTT